MMECIVEGPPQVENISISIFISSTFFLSLSLSLSKAMAVSDSFKMLSDCELIEKLDKSLPSAEFRVLQRKREGERLKGKLQDE